MAHEIDLREGDLAAHVDQAAAWIASGFIIVAPLENGYAYLVDAFFHDGVRAMHVLRGDDLGVAAQVLIAGEEVLAGIARDVPPAARLLMKAFWPGPLSLNLLPHRGLSWDLGDNKDLDLVSVRVPNTEFLLGVLRKSGPLAMASAAKAGQPPVLDKELISIRGSDVEGVFHTGELTAIPGSSVVAANEAEIRVIRIGAITLSELRDVAPQILSEMDEVGRNSEVERGGQ